MGFRSRAARANRAGRFHGAAALAVGASLAGIAALQVSLLGWHDVPQVAGLASLYGTAGLVGTAAGSWAAAWLCADGSGRAVAAWALLVGVGTMALGGAAFAFLYRLGFAQWHEPAFTVAWAFQNAATAAGAVYFWAVLGTRIVLPLALVPLAAGALAFGVRRG